MGRKSRITTEKKLECVLRCINDEDSINHTAQLIGVANVAEIGKAIYTRLMDYFDVLY